jgi:hypothetical protein
MVSERNSSKVRRGPNQAYQTCRNAASVCQKFETSRRRDNVSFDHKTVAPLNPEIADFASGLVRGAAKEGGQDAVAFIISTDVTRLSDISVSVETLIF